ncbi:hypothetical protein BJV77DRAFT_997864, partial [Russula vinacea]
LCKRRGRHVTRSFCRPFHHPPAFPWMAPRTSVPLQFHPPPLPFKFQRNSM